MNNLKLTFEQERELIQFTEAAFNYFNGRINRHYMCNLNIQYMNYERTDVAGDNSYNNITIHLNNIIISQNNIRAIKQDIIQTVIHELYHANQSIDGNRYNLDIKYRDAIENEVIYSTHAYIISNYEEIQLNLGIELDLRLSQYCLDIELQKKRYQIDEKLNLYIFYMNILSRYTPERHIPEIEYALNTISNIIFIYNETQYIIKQNNMFNENIETLFHVYQYVNDYYMYSYAKLLHDKKFTCLYDPTTDTVTYQINFAYMVDPIEYK